MIRNSIRKTKENYASIEELKQQLKNHGSGTASHNNGHSHYYSLSNQHTPNSFDMINTLMVVNSFLENTKFKI